MSAHLLSRPPVEDPSIALCVRSCVAEMRDDMNWMAMTKLELGETANFFLIRAEVMAHHGPKYAKLYGKDVAVTALGILERLTPAEIYDRRTREALDRHTIDVMVSAKALPSKPLGRAIFDVLGWAPRWLW